ncbi:MAG: hypothetical protein ACRELA_15555 [Candidatus Rokuibacteriota bacterium]
MRGTWLLAVAVPAGAGWLIFHAWEPLGLPARGGPLDAPFPGLWRWFFAICLPALFPAFSLVHARLVGWSRAGEMSADVARRVRRWDRLSYGFLPLFVVLMAAWQGLGGWRLPFAIFFVGVLFIKSLGVMASLYAGVFRQSHGEDDPEDPPILHLHLFVVALMLYAFLTPYVITAVSTVSDESLYLLNTHSMFADGDSELQNNVARRDYTRFYWGRPAPQAWTVPFVGFPALLLPGYAIATTVLPHYPLAGRLGATLTIGLFAALLGVQVYRLCRELGASRPAAYWTWLVVAFSPPILTHSSHLFPEVPPALAAVVGVRALLRLPGRPWPALLVVAAAAVFMAALKDRYTPLGLGLLVWAVCRLAAHRRLLTLALGLALLGTGGYLLRVNPLPQFFPNLVDFTSLQHTLLTWNAYMVRAMVGLLADQEFGLLYYAPHWVLAVVGVPLLWRQRRDATLGLLGLFVFHLLVVVKYRWSEWGGGFSPPPRFILSAAPLLAPFIAAAFERCRGRGLATANTLWLLWSGAVAVLLSVVPFWRYNDMDGRSTLLQLLGAELGLDLARFLPSLRAPTAWTWALLGLGGLALVLGALYYARRRPAPGDAWGVGAVVLSPFRALALAAALALLWVCTAAVVPTWSVEGEAMRHSGGIHFAALQSFWVMKREGEITEPIVTWPGFVEITVVAGGYTTTGIAPRLTLLLDDHPIESWTLKSGQGQWVQAEYVTRVRTRFGRPVLRLHFADLLDHRPSGTAQHAYVDRIRLRRTDGTR